MPAWATSALSNRLFQSGVGSIVVRIATAGLAVLTSVVLARALGPEDYGLYAYTLSIILVVAVPAHLGLPTLVTRETAIAQSRGDWARMKGVWLWSTKAAGAISAVIAVLGAIAAVTWSERLAPGQPAVLAWAVLLIPLIAVGTLRGAALRGLHKPVLGQLPYQIIRPALLIGAVALIGFGLDVGLSAADAMAVHVGAALLAFIAGAAMLWRARPPGIGDRALGPTYASRAWIMSTLPLSLIAGMNLLNQNLGVLVLGANGDPTAAGVFQVVMQGGLVLVLGQAALDMVVAPRFARLHALGEREKLQRLVALSACASLALAVPVALIYIVLGGPLLGVVFGASFRDGATALAIVSVGQVINAGFGSVNALLNMTGFERDTARSLTIAGVTHVAAAVVMVPFLGLTGAALSAAATLLIWNLLQWRMIRKRLQLESTVLAIYERFRPRRAPST